MITISEVSRLRTPASQDMPTRKLPRQTSREGQKQPTAPKDNPQCKDTKHRLKRAERSLLFLTTAGAVCQIGDHKWYGMCVLTLAMLATGAQAVDVSEPPDLREKRVASPERYRLEAYDCSEPEEAIIANIPPECAAKEERSSLPEFKRTT